ncbi:MAG: ATP-binding cassette domain-containing protein [Deltaproteobacteria bacterium]|nr:ATP-binding cassette domain-containing protein [Deltaproteobacteria bacterium]MBW2051984.1 ATP-binding cassette domain-containing protein [Deltaproteobacteria bacterium]MBW2141061.1 ATP-binding cassette domain-containing protein [Deltaproteobacteria bacterium]MBW2323125.1 ATP-binding cassette domain-containing protein [Deltaproteobacteria bacterium]
MTPLLELIDLEKNFKVKASSFRRSRETLTAVNRVNLEIRSGECLGLVGESGCGKTTLARLIVRLEKPSKGRIIFDGQDLSNLNHKDEMIFRRRVQMIFQDPYSSLNPRKTVGSIIGESWRIHSLGNSGERREKVMELMEEVGLRPEFYSRYPHEFSGGQRQRVGIARALSLNPDLIVADEPVSALDVSIQAQVINLLKDLQSKFNLTYLFIAHNLSLVRHVADCIAVMYLGQLVELVPKELFGKVHHHPYTLALLASIPIAKPGAKKKAKPLLGDVPSPINPPSGCTFHPRCPEQVEVCHTIPPELREVSLNHCISCHRR